MGDWRWRWGEWRGRADIGGFLGVPAILSGGLLRPDPGCLSAAAGLGPRGDGLLREVDEALERRLECWRLDGLPLMSPGAAGGGPAVVRPRHVLVSEGGRAIEVGFPVPWDEEHLWGARFRDWALAELCESVLPRA